MDPEKMKAMTDVSDQLKPASVDTKEELIHCNVDMKMYIGKQLQAVYDEILQQPVPDRFKDLLKRLDESGQGKE